MAAEGWFRKFGDRAFDFVDEWWDDVVSDRDHGRLKRTLRWLRNEGNTVSTVLAQAGFYGFGILVLGDAVINKVRLGEFSSAAFNSVLAGALGLAGLQITLAGRGTKVPPVVRPLGESHRVPEFSSQTLTELSLWSPITARELLMRGGFDLAPIHQRSVSPHGGQGLIPIVVNPSTDRLLIVCDQDLAEALERCEADAHRRQLIKIQYPEVLGRCADVVAGIAHSVPSGEFSPAILRTVRDHGRCRPALVRTTRVRQRVQRRTASAYAFSLAWMMTASGLLLAAAMRMSEVRSDVRESRGLTQAESSLANGDTAEAQALFTAILSQNPGSTRAALGLACVAAVEDSVDDWLVAAQRAHSEGASPEAIIRCIPTTSARQSFVLIFAVGGAILTLDSSPDSNDDTAQLSTTRRDEMIGTVAASAACSEADAGLFRSSALHAFVAAHVPDIHGRQSAIALLTDCADGWSGSPYANEISTWLDL